MIIGIGSDIVRIDRIRAACERSGDALIRRILTAGEQALLTGLADRSPYLAGRWAAKEAVAKALGTGFGRDCAWTDVEVLRSPLGAPIVTLHGAGAKTAARLGIARVHLSISHEQDYAVAFAIAEGD